MNLKEVLVKLEKALSGMTYEDFFRLSWSLGDLKDSIRETLQKETKSKIESIISKLKNNQNLTSEELKFVEMWVVGDASYYVDAENNFSDWLKEFERLKQLIAGFDRENLTKEETLKLYGIIQDMTMLVPLISNFIEKKERVKMFKTTTEVLDPLERKTLLGILETKLKSPDF